MQASVLLSRAICSTARPGGRTDTGCCDIFDCGAAVLQGCCSREQQEEVQRTLLGIVQPGDSIPVPYSWRKAGVLYLSQLVFIAQTTLQ